MKKIERFLGCMLGLATGDAVGTTAEFKPRGSFQPVTDVVGGGTFGLEPGQWTEDNSMTLCLAASLTETGRFDVEDQMKRYCRWLEKGYMSSTGECFDIGNATRAALSRFRSNGNPIAGSTSPHSAGNGSLMRLAPVPLFFANAPRTALDSAAESSRTTHGAGAAVDACRYFAGLVLGAIAGESKETILLDCYCPVPGYWKEQPLCEEIELVAQGSFKCKSGAQVQSSGFVVHTLEAALWAFLTAAASRRDA
jgi:ADP-ribosyl-[dinitrogen reductase] hydrolase